MTNYNDQFKAHMLAREISATALSTKVVLADEEIRLLARMYIERETDHIKRINAIYDHFRKRQFNQLMLLLNLPKWIREFRLYRVRTKFLALDEKQTDLALSRASESKMHAIFGD